MSDKDFLTVVLILGPILIILGESAYIIFTWLRDGYSSYHTLCGTFELLCNPSTEMLGVNKILYWIGNHSINYALSAIALFSTFILESVDF